MENLDANMKDLTQQLKSMKAGDTAKSYVWDIPKAPPVNDYVGKE